MALWGQIVQQVKKLWTNFATWQKVTLVGVSVVALISVIILVVMGQQPKMEALYTNLDPSDASAIIAKLKEQKVNYELTNEGKTIMVPSKDKYQLRLDMANTVSLNGVVGFESFNETRFGETDTDKRVRFIIALQGELTRTIEELDEVENAKVHIALPASSLFIENEKDVTASVLLRLKPYAQLKPEQVKSVLSFVSHSVEGLKAENVSVMDVNGNLLSEGLADTETGVNTRVSATQIALKQQYEKDLARSVQSMLERMRGAGKAVVRANITLDFDQVEKQSETYTDPVVLSEQSKEETSTGTNTSAGGNPVDANTAGPSYGSIGSGNSEYSLTESRRDYEISKTVEKTVTAPGKVIKVSLSVLIDGELTNDEQSKIADAVSKAAGVDVSRGDQISVVGMPFNNEQEQKLADELAQAEKSKQRITLMKVAGAALGFLALVAVGVVLMRRSKYGEPLPKSALTSAFEEMAVGDPESDLMMPTLTPEALEKKNLRQQIDKLTQTNPNEVANVLKTWLIEE